MIKLSTYYAVLLGAALWAMTYGLSTAQAQEVPNVSLSQDVTAPLGSYRLLVSCLADDSDTPRYDDINWPEFDDRDLLLIEMHADKIYTIIKNEIGMRRLEHKAKPNPIRAIANCETDGEFVLIGKDGTLKQRWQSGRPVEALYTAIDAMPMRRYEMR